MSSKHCGQSPQWHSFMVFSAHTESDGSSWKKRAGEVLILHLTSTLHKLGNYVFLVFCVVFTGPQTDHFDHK